MLCYSLTLQLLTALGTGYILLATGNLPALMSNR